MDIVGDWDYMKGKLLVWDISPLPPIKLHPWDLDLYQAVSRLAFKEPGFQSEQAARIMVF